MVRARYDEYGSFYTCNKKKEITKEEINKKENTKQECPPKTPGANPEATPEETLAAKNILEKAFNKKRENPS